MPYKCQCNLCDMIEHSTWISVKERLPKEHQSVLASDGDEVGQYFFIKGSFETDEGYYLNATHWMPLPKPPEVE